MSQIWMILHRRYLWFMVQRLASSHHEARDTTGSTSRQRTRRADSIPATATGDLPRERLFANVGSSSPGSPPSFHWRCWGFWLKPQSNPNQIKCSVASSIWAHNKKIRAPTARGSPETKTKIKIKKIKRSKNHKKILKNKKKTSKKIKK